VFRLIGPARARLARRRLSARPRVGPRRPAAGSGTHAAELADLITAWGVPDEARSRPRAERLLSGHLDLLGRSLRLEEIDWTGRPHSHLWTYHLHYFDYAVDLAWAHRRGAGPAAAGLVARLCGEWLERTPPFRGDGWDPYPTSVRLANWARARLLLGTALDPAVAAEMDRSIALQTEWVGANLEYHLLGNHLLKNIRALSWGGAYGAGDRGGHWRQRAYDLLLRQALDQFLTDGVHHERSSMYHAAALADVLEAFALLRPYGMPLPEGLAERLALGLQFAADMTRKDGTLHLFQDSVERAAPGIGYLRRAAASAGIAVDPPVGSEPGPGARVYPEGRYFMFLDADAGERLIVDGGAPGPAHQPGHAHCGALGFTLDFRDAPVVVDPGVHGYEGDRFRAYSRSTAAHSTVRIGGGEQSEMWATFRVARRARVRSAMAAADGARWLFQGECSPYHSPGAVHARRIQRVAPGEWRVTDRVDGADGARMESFLHLHPRFQVRPRDGGFIAEAADCRVGIEPFGWEEARVARGEETPPLGWYFPDFGRAEAAPVLVFTRAAGPGDSGYRLRCQDARAA
jgi:uncharacterized heparinase superfamily protein